MEWFRVQVGAVARKSAISRARAQTKTPRSSKKLNWVLFPYIKYAVQKRRIERRWQTGTRTLSTSTEIRAAAARHRVIKCLKRHRQHYIRGVCVCSWRRWATSGVTRGGAETQDTRWIPFRVCVLFARFISGELDLKQTRIAYLLPGRAVYVVFSNRSRQIAQRFILSCQAEKLRTLCQWAGGTL
jgi:hypothetical protein